MPGMSVEEIIEKAILEDTGDGDHTSLSTIPPDARGMAALVIKEEGILSGVDVARKVFQAVDRDIVFKEYIPDGSRVFPGNIAFEVEGRSVSILAGERLALNFMQRMSGIATYTRFLADKIKGTGAIILDTRKTTPNLRILEKEAVRTGGGHNHRMGLYDMIMIKDNHVDFAGGISQAIDAAQDYLKRKNLDLRIEIEVRNFNELQEVLDHGKIDRIMLDNFSPADLRKAIEMIGKRYETEASGGIKENNIREYAGTGVDFISVGALTHQIKSLDMSLKAVT